MTMSAAFSAAMAVADLANPELGTVQRFDAERRLMRSNIPGLWSAYKAGVFRTTDEFFAWYEGRSSARPTPSVLAFPPGPDAPDIAYTTYLDAMEAM